MSAVSPAAKEHRKLQKKLKRIAERDVNPEQFRKDKRNYTLLIRYGIDQVQFDRIREAQNNICMICERPFRPSDTPSVEHNHATGDVRGLAHRWCNLAIGVLGDSPEALRAVAHRLELSEIKTMLVLEGK